MVNEKFWKIRISRGFDREGGAPDYPTHSSMYVFEDKIYQLLDLLDVGDKDRKVILEGKLT